MAMILSSSLTMEFVQALNPLYAFPIVAVILCAFIVYAFGFKSPVQPPSFDGIEEEKKTSRKRKTHTKDSSKGKVIQNGKANGSASNKSHAIASAKKKDSEKLVAADKPVVEKSTEKKVSKKAKQNEKKVQEKKESFSLTQEDTGEDGWVQLISKKGRKSRKKDEMVATETQAVVKPLKNSHIDKSGENIVSSEEHATTVDVLEKPIPEKKLGMGTNKGDVEVANLENQDKIVIIQEDSALDESNLETIPLKDVFKNDRLNEETGNKSKKKKKKNAEVVNINNDCIISSSESPAVQVVPEILPFQNAANNASIISETPKIITDIVQENESKESKSSNVVFDELADLYPREKEKKKKKVRRDH